MLERKTSEANVDHLVACAGKVSRQGVKVLTGAAIDGKTYVLLVRKAPI